MKSLDRKNILITGASGGLGAAVAVACAKQGANVAINFLPGDEQAASATAMQCEDIGVDTLVLPGDVSDDESCRKMASEISSWGDLHGLVNNAGMTVHVPDHGNLEALSGDDFQRVFAVNVLGPFQMIRSMRPYLENAAKKCNTSSAIVNVSSTAGISGGGSSLAYAASKGALNTLTRSLAGPLAPLIRVNAVCPAIMKTGWFETVFGADSARSIFSVAKKLSVLNEVMRPENAAEVIAFLCSDSSRYIIGELVTIGAGIGLSKCNQYQQALCDALERIEQSES